MGLLVVVPHKEVVAVGVKEQVSEVNERARMCVSLRVCARGVCVHVRACVPVPAYVCVSVCPGQDSLRR